jgi:hypothetical protein
MRAARAVVAAIVLVVADVIHHEAIRHRAVNRLVRQYMGPAASSLVGDVDVPLAPPGGEGEEPAALRVRLIETLPVFGEAQVPLRPSLQGARALLSRDASTAKATPGAIGAVSTAGAWAHKSIVQPNGDKMSHRDENHDGLADQTEACCGEDRQDPDSWDDPEIITEPWEEPGDVAE